MRSFLLSFKYAASGVVHAIRTQRNMRVHVFVAVCAIAAAFALQLTPSEWGIILLCVAGVFSAECFNTAIEANVDIASPEQQELARIAKDCAAGAVLVMAVCSVIAGLIIYVHAALRLLALV